jgi:hypothetical protein
MSQFDWSITQKKNQTMEAPKIEGSVSMSSIPPH